MRTAKKAKSTGDEELSLFPELDANVNEVKVTQSAAERPQWEFFALDYIDFIADETILAWCYRLDVLERNDSPFYGRPVFNAAFHALRALSECSRKSLRNQSFTVYTGDSLGAGAFVLGASFKTSETADFLSRWMKSVPGYDVVESASSDNFMPMLRYDNGFVIEYSDGGLEGTSYIDSDDQYGTGLTIYRRDWRPAEDINRSRSVYGKLVKPGRKQGDQTRGKL